MENHEASKRLYRSRQQHMIAGVAGGLGQYFGIDPTLVRLAFVVTALIPGLGGVSILGYIVLAIVVPMRPTDQPEPAVYATPIDTRRGREIVGIALVALGLLALSGTLGLFHLFDWFAWRYFWPVLLIAAGAFLLLRQRD
ncbi:MAG: PspC domain-containing protein [Chloroflexota bacterium]